MSFTLIPGPQPPICTNCKKTVWTVTAAPNAPAREFCQCTVKLDRNFLLEAAMRQDDPPESISIRDGQE